MKSSALVLAGLLGAGAVAGGTVAVMRQPTVESSPAVISSPTATATSGAPVVSSPNPTSNSPTPKASSPATATLNAASRGTTPPAPTSSQTRREVKSCKVLMAIVNDDNPPLNVRATPSTDAAIVGTLEDGTFVSVKQEQNGWFEIAEPAGWIAKSKTASRCSQKIEQVQFGAGKTDAELADEFLGTGSHKYKLNLDKGQKLTVTGDVGPMPAVIDPDGKYLVGMDEQTDSWSTKLSQSGEYTLELDSNFRGYKYDFSVEVE